jgi:hypothetical protein
MATSAGDEGGRTAGEAGSARPLRQRSLRELVGLLSADAQALVKQEVALVRGRAEEAGRAVGRGTAMLAAAAGLALFAAAVLTAGIVLALAEFMPGWLAAVIVAAVYALVAAVLGQRGRTVLEREAAPKLRETTASIKEDVEWIKNRRNADAS